MKDDSRKLRAYPDMDSTALFATDDVERFCGMLANEQGSHVISDEGCDGSAPSVAQAETQEGFETEEIASGFLSNEKPFSRNIRTPSGQCFIYTFKPTPQMEVPSATLEELRQSKPWDVMHWWSEGKDTKFNAACSSPADQDAFSLSLELTEVCTTATG